MNTKSSTLLIFTARLLILIASPLQAANFNVTSPNNAGPGSLRAAVAIANGNATADTIHFDLPGGVQTIVLATPIEITSPVTIEGTADRIPISGGNGTRLFNITASGAGKVTFDRLRLQAGAEGQAAIVRVTGATTEACFNDVIFEDSHAFDAIGNGGGAMIINSATVEITDSVFHGNLSQSDGGALVLQNSADLTMTNTTLSNNRANGHGGGIHNDSSHAELIHTTIAHNTADLDTNGAGLGGGVFAFGTGTFDVGNSIIAENTNFSAANGSGLGFTSLGHNLIGISFSGFVDGVLDDQVGSVGLPLDPMLEALADNGGDTLTHHLLDGSAAIDAADDTMATDADQRGQTRPFNATADIGAYESPRETIVSIAIPIRSTPGTREDEEPRETVRFTASLDSPAEVEFEIDSSSTATVNADFTLSAADPITDLGNGRFSLTNSNDSFEIRILLDTEPEGDETVIINLINGMGYEIDPSAVNGNSVSVTINDDDIEVTNTNDAGPGSLRDAIDQVTLNGGGGVSIPSHLTPITVSTPLTVNGWVHINGNGTTVQGDGSLGVFAVLGSGTGCAILEDLVITGGDGLGGGGGILTSGAFTCLEIVDCAITGNTTSTLGGGLHIVDADVTLRQSSVDNNTADDSGGGVYVSGTSASLTILNSTLAQNEAMHSGGGLYAMDAAITVYNATITENACDSDGNGIGNGGGVNRESGFGWVTFYNSIVAGNTDTLGIGDYGPDIYGDVSTGGQNIISDNGSIEFFHPVGSPNANGDYIGNSAAPLDPQLTAVDSVPLHYVFAQTSIARDNGDSAAIASFDPVDQRGSTRVYGAAVDIGAVEMDYLTVLNNNNGGFGSLRERLAFGSALGHATIVFDETQFAAPETINLTSGELTVGGAIHICAPDHGVTLDAGGNSRVMLISPPQVGAEVSLKNLTLRGGASIGASGGGLRIEGAPVVLIDCCTIEDNVSSSHGGGVYVDGLNGDPVHLTMIDTTISGNNADGVGGGLWIHHVVARIKRTTFANNHANSGGGLTHGDDCVFIDCTISGNTANNHGGGVYGGSAPAVRADFLGCTITNNRADVDADGGGDGGGIRAWSGIALHRVTLGNTIVAGNFDDSPSGFEYHGQLTGYFFSFGHNFISRLALNYGTGFFDGVNGDQTGEFGSTLDPMLGALLDHGGKTPTHRPLPGSPLIDAGDNSMADLQLIDQIGDLRIVGPNVDIGSVEFVPQPTLVSVVDTSASEDGSDIATLHVVRTAFDGDLDVGLRIEAVANAAAFDDFDFVVVGGGSVTQDASSATVTIPDGQADVQLNVVPIDDALTEGQEILQVHTIAGAFNVPNQIAPPADIIIADNDFNVTVTDYGDSGPGTLREAVATLAASGGEITIDNTIVDGISRPATITLASQIDVSSDITICGPQDNAAGITISGGGNVRVFEVGGSGHLTLKDLTVSDGTGPGGAIWLRDTSSATLLRCTFTGNHSDFSGGAIETSSPGNLEATNCTFSGNTANVHGGAIRVLNTAVTLLNCTLCLNIADVDADNNGDGGAIHNSPLNSVTLRNTLIATNSPTNAFGILTSDGGNLIDVDTGLNIANHATDQIGTAAAPIDPIIDQLRMNGGPVMTHALLLNSPALDAGGNNGTPSADARSLPRIFNGQCDIGAYEHQYVSYDFWSEFMFPIDPAADYSIGLDYDTDGILNGLEQLLGTNPMVGEIDPITGALHPSGDLVIEFPLEMMVDPNSMVVNVSSDLTTWSPLATPPQIVGQHGVATRLLRARIPANGGLRIFAQVVRLP